MPLWFFKFFAVFETEHQLLALLVNLLPLVLAVAWIFYNRWSKDYLRAFDKGRTESGELSDSVKYLLTQLERPERRRRRRDYLDKLQRLLAWSERYWGPLEPRTGKLTAWFGFAAWRPQSYEFSLRLAFVYPIFSLLLVWAISGENTSGIPGLLPDDLNIWWRLAAIASLGFIFGSWHYHRKTGSIFLLIIAVAVAFAGAVAGLIVVVLLQEWAEDNDRLGRFYTGHWLFFVGMVLLTAWLAVDISTGDSRLVWVVLVFMAMLPLLNAFCDWLSIGVTRSLLATTLQQKGRGAVWRSGLDLLLAVLSLGLLSLAATAFLQALNLLAAAGGGGEVFDLDGLIFKLRHQPWDRELWWVYFTLFSTLLPTFVHGFVGVWSLLGFTWPAKKRQQYIAEIRDGAALGEDSLRAVDIARAFAGRDVLALLLTFFGVAFLLWMLLWGVPGLARSLLPGCWGLR